MNPEEPYLKSAVKAQLFWGLDLFTVYLQLCKKKETLDISKIEVLEGSIQKLSKQVSEGNSSAEEVLKQFNDTISLVNLEMKKRLNLSKYAPCPFFSIMQKGEEESAILEQLDFVERVLTEAAIAEVLDWSKEGSYFAEVLEIFSQVESKHLAPQAAMAKLVNELKNINGSLGAEYQFPLPDLNAYE